MVKVRISAAIIIVAAALVGYFSFKSGAFPYHLGLDLSGGSHLVYQADTSAVAPGQVDDAMNALAGDISHRINIFGATMLAMTLAVAALVEQMTASPEMVLIDGNMTPERRVAGWCWPARAIVGGDAMEPVISAASIIAKTHRDRLMQALAQAHPGYGWERNAGYGTREHMAALTRLGPTPHHRRSFAPVAQAALLF